MSNEIINTSKHDELKAHIDELTCELEKAQQNLLKQEYEGGIVEMSVSVLHNIGNTLTPSKIALSMLQQRMHNSPLRKHIRKILEPLALAIPECNIAEEEKQKLLKVISLLPGGMEEEYEQNIEDIKKIQDKQEHIASIIALQMRYSHLKADYCEVNVQRIIDDAISMQLESIKKRGIKITREIADVSTVKIQESKLLQLLVNLIKNAYESIDLSPAKEHQITINCAKECSMDGISRIAITIKDTGAGFSNGAEKKFFDFGYSSKSGGSGFGLHYCAHFLKSIGGEITAHSEGEGKGANFTIYIPI